MAAQEQFFLGEPEWESLPSGRIRCIQTGHEMPLAAQATYASTKKCRSALFEAALKKRTPPLNFFDQSPVAQDKIICKITGVVLNKKEEAVWKHMLGKKFEQKLVEKEAEKNIVREDVEMMENSSEKPKSKQAVAAVTADDEGKLKARKKGKAAVTNQAVEQQEDGSSDDSDFWVPPAGDRWDFDMGSDDRWEEGAQDMKQKAVKVTGNIEAAAALDDGDTEMINGEDSMNDSSSSDDADETIRTKRSASASRSLKKKKRAKRPKAETSKQN